MSITTTLEAMKAKRDEAGEDGFTLIELLVVVVIIGILVAIAIPLYLNYRQGAENKSAESDVRGAISAAEQFYTSNGNEYAASASDDSSFDLGTGNQTTETIVVGSNNTVAYVKTTDGYKLCGTNSSGQHVFTYDSTVGGAVKDEGKGTMDATSCAFSAA